MKQDSHDVLVALRQELISSMSLCIKYKHASTDNLSVHSILENINKALDYVIQSESE